MTLWGAVPVPIRRVGYRVAYALLRVYWLVRCPTVTGAKCVLTHGNLVLLVRHTYGRPGWDLPGGAVKTSEPPETTAHREMQEELGLSIESLRRVGEIHGFSEHRGDVLHCFQAELNDRDVRQVTLDRGEIAAAAWFPRTELPPDLGTYVRRALALVAG